MTRKTKEETARLAQPVTNPVAAVTAMRRQLVASLRLQGVSVSEIPERLSEVDCFNSSGGLWDESVIQNDLRMLANDWQKSSRAATSEHISETLAKLREVERIAWERRDLDSVLKAIDKEMRLLGLTAATTVSLVVEDRATELAALAGVDKETLLKTAKALAAGEAP